jgi:GldM C-terminal domain
MKTKWLGLSLLLLVPTALAAQVQLRNLSLSSPDSAVLYIGINNQLTVAGFKHLQNITLHYHDNIVSPNKDGLFHVAVVTKGNMPIAVFQGHRKVKEISFAVRQITDPVVVLGNWQDNNIPKDSLLLNRRLRIIFPDCLIDYRDEVLYFDFQIITGNQSGTVHHIKGNRMPDELLPQLAKLQTGDKLIFTNICSSFAFIHNRFSFSLTIQ